MNSNCSTTTTTTNSRTKSSRSSCYNRSKATKTTTNSMNSTTNSNSNSNYCYCYCYYYSNSFSSSSSRLSLRLSTCPLSSSTLARVFSSRRTSTPRPSQTLQTLETSSSLPIVSTFASSTPYSRTSPHPLVLTRTRTSSGWTKNIADTFCSSLRFLLCAFRPTAPCFCACLG